MILPPFFGYNIPSKDRDIYKLYESYLSQDIISYTIPTPTVIQTYLGHDILTYVKQNDIINVTYLSEDILGYNIPTKNITMTYMSFDVLSYDPPPTTPNAPNFIFARDWDSSADLIWTEPSSPLAPVTGYNIQYSGLNNGFWTNYKNTSLTSIYVTGLTNNIEYKLRVAGINSYGTGNYAISNSIIPSGGDDSYCRLALYLPFDNDIIDKSCSIKNTTIYSPAINSIDVTLSDYKYGLASLFMNGSGYNSNTEFPHILVGSGQNINWNFSGNFTMETFFKISDGSYNGTIFSIKQETINNTGLIRLALKDNNSSMVFDFNQNFYDTNSNQHYISNNSLSGTGFGFSTDWHHVAVVRSNNIISMYIDGERLPNTITTSIAPTLTGVQLYLGLDSLPLGNAFGGYIDQFMIFNSSKYRANFIPSEYTIESDCDCGYDLHISRIDNIITW